MKNKLLKLSVFLLSFLFFVFLFEKTLNHVRTDSTVQMEEASLPLLTLVADGRQMNTLHGYKKEMDTAHIRSTIFALPENRQVSARVFLYGGKVKDASFEVRSTDGKNLVEQTNIPDLQKEENTDSLLLHFAVKDLIEVDREYMLVLVLHTEQDQSVRYYTRIVLPGEEGQYDLQDQVDFALDFSAKTLARDRSISRYLETTALGKTDSPEKVDIHSGFAQITYQGLKVTRNEEPEVDVFDIRRGTISLRLTYPVVVEEDGKRRTCRVKENFFLRHAGKKTYLLRYQRTMNTIFDPKEVESESDQLKLFICNKDAVTLSESEGGGVFSFVNEGRLFLCNLSDRSFVNVFGFYESDHWDPRTFYDGATIRILKTDETSGLTFLVTGYMNRGSHEGETGTALYRYDPVIAAVEELAWIPDVVSEDILKAEVQKLHYLNNDDTYFTEFGDEIYQINLKTQEEKLLVGQIGEKNLAYSQDGSRIAYEEKTKDNRTLIREKDLGSGKERVFRASENSSLKVLGFIGDDLIYGVADPADAGRNQSGEMVFAMAQVKIAGSEGESVDSYQAPGFLVTGVQVKENQIILHRVKKTDTGLLVEASNDQIISKDAAGKESNHLQVVKQKMESEARKSGLNPDAPQETQNRLVIVMREPVRLGGARVRTPGEVEFEGNRTIVLHAKDRRTEYYAYAERDVVSEQNSPAEPVKQAYENFGQVVDDQNQYVYYRGNLQTRNQMMALTGAVEGKDYSNQDSTTVCLDVILNNAGVSRDAAGMLKEGQSAAQILKSAMPDTQVLPLDGCPLPAMLYYVNQDSAVMASFPDGHSVLLIGFNELNTVIFDPKKGSASVYKYGMNDSLRLFTEAGSHFLTYLPPRE